MTPLTPNDHALLLLGSHLALPRDASCSPFTVGQWNKLDQHLSNTSLCEPGALLGCTESSLTEIPGIDNETAARITALVARAGNLGIELEHLASRGVWIATRYSEHYPQRFRERLGDRAPLVLFGTGSIPHSGPFVAVIGSRDVDESGVEFCTNLARQVAEEGGVIISGAARGVDRHAMTAALEHGGQAIGVLPHGLDRIMNESDIRRRILEETLSLMSPYAPKAPFSVGNAMGRNKLVYALADYAVVVSSGKDSGGTWTGAVENLKHEWAPLFVRNGTNMPGGNLALIDRGAIPLELSTNGISTPGPITNIFADLCARHESNGQSSRTGGGQGVLF